MNNSRRINGEGVSGDLVGMIFSWSLIDVFNGNLLKDKVQKIPKTFTSLENYLSSYTFPLIEEVRSDLCSCLEAISRAPFTRIRSVNQVNPKLKQTTYPVMVDSYGTNYEPKNSDIFVISETRPRHVADLTRGGRAYMIGFITRRVEHSDLYIIRTSGSLEIEKPRGSQSRRNTLFAVFLLNMTTYIRIWESLILELAKKRNINIINQVFCYDSAVEGECVSSLYPMSVDLLDSDLRITLDKFNLNYSQQNTVRDCISASQQYHKNSIKLVWGPPGTGKTKTISSLLLILLSRKCKTLTCAPTNTAIIEVISRLVKLVKDSSCDFDYSLGDLVLFGNKDRMQINDDLKEVFLDDRVRRLSNCLCPLTGWKNCLNNLKDFLQNGNRQYTTFMKKKEKEGTCKLSFKEFVITRFCVHENKFTNCMKVLCTDLPSSSFSGVLFQKMILIIDLLKYFGSLLQMKNVHSYQLDHVFLRATGEIYDEFPSLDSLESIKLNGSMTNKLYKTRKFSIQILGALYKNIKTPDFNTWRETKDFCLGNATLVFCTASSSYKLHDVEMDKTLELLIVDEAAQLKECESLIPLQLSGIRNAVFIGDEFQLSPFVKSQICQNAGFGTSLFERLSSLGHKKHLLDVQYRMHPSISKFPNASFYESKISDGPNVICESYKKIYLSGPMFGAYSFINIERGKETMDKQGRSTKNMIEVAVVHYIVKNLFKASNEKKQKLCVGVVSPYTAQVVAIQEKIGKAYEMSGDFSVKIKSIDSFQGGEEDIVILSTVRCNTTGSVGFLSNTQRTNVALTRAKHCLWILGNGPTLANSGTIWEELVIDAEKRGCFFDASEDKGLADTIVNAFVELDELEAFLNMDSFHISTTRWQNQKKKLTKIQDKPDPLTSAQRQSPTELLHIKTVNLLEEYFHIGLLDEAQHCVEELKSPDYHPEVVKEVIDRALDKGRSFIDPAVKLLLYLLGKKVFTRVDIKRGCLLYASMLDEVSLDLPRAPTYFGEFLGKIITVCRLEITVAEILMRVEDKVFHYAISDAVVRTTQVCCGHLVK